MAMLQAAAVFLFACYICNVIRCRFKYPPGPIPWPMLGNLLQLDADAPHRTIYEWSQRYGPVFTIWLPKPHIIVADYQLINEALTKNGDALSGRPIGFVFGQLAPDADGCGIILCQGPKWRTQRRFTLQVLRELGVNRHAMEDRIVEQVDQLTNRIKHNFRRSPEGARGHRQSVIDLDIPLHLLVVVHIINRDYSLLAMKRAVGCVVNVINAVVMGTTWREDDPRFFHLKTMINQQIRNVQSAGMQLVDAYPWLRHLPVPGRFGLTEYKHNQAELSRFFMRQVAEHEQALKDESLYDSPETLSAPPDLATAYLREMARRRQQSIPLDWFDNWQLMIIMGDLWAAGMETTVSTLRWAILYMIHHPAIQSQVRHEIRTNIGDRQVSYGDRAQLPLTVATLHEVQRHANIVPVNIPHKATQDIRVGGYTIRAGSTVVPQISCVHMDPRNFDRPDEFRPSRFVITTKHGEEVRLNSRLVQRVVPFSLGKRQCLGEGLARMQLFLIFTSLIQKFEFAPEEPGGELPSLQPVVGITMSPQPYHCLVSEVALDTIAECDEESTAPAKDNSFYSL